jgi:hypothetical protein
MTAPRRSSPELNASEHIRRRMLLGIELRATIGLAVCFYGFLGFARIQRSKREEMG